MSWKENFLTVLNISDLRQLKLVKSNLCVTTPKTDSATSNVLDPAQPEAVKRKLCGTSRNAKKVILYCGSCENILKEKLKVYKDFYGLWYMGCVISLEMFLYSKRKVNKWWYLA